MKNKEEFEFIKEQMLEFVNSITIEEFNECVTDESFHGRYDFLYCLEDVRTSIVKKKIK